MLDLFNQHDIFEFIKFFILYFTEISLLFFCVSFLVFIVSEKFSQKLKNTL